MTIRRPHHVTRAVCALRYESRSMGLAVDKVLFATTQWGELRRGACCPGDFEETEAAQASSTASERQAEREKIARCLVDFHSRRARERGGRLLLSAA